MAFVDVSGEDVSVARVSLRGDFGVDGGSSLALSAVSATGLGPVPAELVEGLDL